MRRFRRTPRPATRQNRSAWLISGGVPLLQVNRFITTVFVDLCGPYFLHALMLGWAETHGRAESDVEVAEIFESRYQFFGVQPGAILFQRSDQHVCRHVAIDWLFRGPKKPI